MKFKLRRSKGLSQIAYLIIVFAAISIGSIVAWFIFSWTQNLGNKPQAEVTFIAFIKSGGTCVLTGSIHVVSGTITSIRISTPAAGIYDRIVSITPSPLTSGKAGKFRYNFACSLSTDRNYRILIYAIANTGSEVLIFSGDIILVPASS